MFCQKCGTLLQDNSTVCNTCGNQIIVDDSMQLFPQPKSKVKVKTIVLSVIAALIAIAVLATFIFLAFSGNYIFGPLAVISNAASKNMEAGFNVDFNLSVKLHGKDEVEVPIAFQVIPFENKDGDPSFEFAMKAESNQIYFNEEYFLSNTVNNNYENGYLARVDNAQSEILTAEMAELLSKKDLESLVEYLNHSNGNIFNEEIFVKRIKDVARDLSSKKYLKENFGYSKSKKDGKTTVSFNVDVMKAYELFYNTVEESKDVFVKESDYEQYLNKIEDSIDGLRKEKYDIRFIIDIVIENSYIIDVNGKLFYANNSPIDDQRRSYTYSFEAEINDIGEAEIDSEVIEQFNKRKKKLGDRDEIYWDAAGHYYFEHYKKVYIDWTPVNP